MFDFSKVNVHWFPSHMAKGIEIMEKRLAKADLLVEVRDARIPFSSANPILEEMARDKNRIVVFNKTDLSDKFSNGV
jgi:ribosome biogenesis GTPase A